MSRSDQPTKNVLSGNPVRPELQIIESDDTNIILQRSSIIVWMLSYRSGNMSSFAKVIFINVVIAQNRLDKR